MISWSTGVRVAAGLMVCACPPGASAQELQAGTVIERVQCAGHPAQTYALYLPSNYSPGRPSGVLLAFHPMARGQLMVEKYRAAAEQYGYIVAGSNNSRNGAIAISAEAAEAMSADVQRRFAIDPQQVYLTGMSGGARMALAIALAKNNIAGVIASAAGYPDSQPRRSVPFAIFGTTGTEDFNYNELRLLDRKLTSPHFLAVFHGGHGLPPDAVAFDALEWMTLQAMRSGRRTRDDAILTRMLEKRHAAIEASTEAADRIYLLRALVSDFTSLADVSGDAARVEALSRDPDVKKALKRQRESEDTEERLLREVFQLEIGLADGHRDEALLTLRDRITTLSRKAGADAETPERNQARRLLRSITLGARGRVQDPEYLALLEKLAG